jgi:hypothetical protein
MKSMADYLVSTTLAGNSISGIAVIIIRIEKEGLHLGGMGSIDQGSHLHHRILHRRINLHHRLACPLSLGGPRFRWVIMEIVMKR